MKQKITLLALLINLSLFAQNFIDSNIALPNLVFSTSSLVDVDGDGDLDMYLSGMDENGTVVGGLYLNDGTSFTLSTTSNLPPVVFGSSDWGDIDNDGDMDVILIGEDTSYTTFTEVFTNDGNGNFTSLNLNLPVVEQGSVAFVDYNNDDFLDISYSGIGTVDRLTKFFTNNANNTFTELTGVAVPGLNYGEIKWADYDNDGDEDFIIAGFDDNTGGTDTYYTELFINNGNSTFSVSSEVFHKGWLGEIKWVDYNNDGKMDVMLTGVGGTGDVRFSKMYKNNGDGTFTDTYLGFPLVSHSSFEWQDFDLDGDLDLFITGVTTTPGDGNNVSTVFRNDGNDTFVNLGLDTTLTASYYGDSASGDINGDGKPDIVITGYTGIYVYSSKVFYNTLTAGVSDANQNFNLSFYPNPNNSGFFKVESMNEQIKELNIFTVSGKKLNEFKYSNSILDVSSFSKGVYFIQVKTNNNVFSKKIVLK